MPAHQCYNGFVELLLTVFPDSQPEVFRMLWGRLVSQQIQLERLLAELSYPLGLTAGEWFREQKRFEEGERSGRLPFLVCRVLGVSVRLAAAIAIRALAESQSRDVELNVQVLKTLRHPSDGGWLELLRLVSKALPLHPWARFLRESLEQRYSTPDPTGTLSQSESSFQAMERLVAFRNALIHGNAPTEPQIMEASGHVEVLLRGFSWLAQHQIRVRWEGREWALVGAAPFPLEEGRDAMPPVLADGEVYLLDPSGARPPLSLSPLLVFRPGVDGSATVETDELWFLNSGSLERLAYIGYRSTAIADGKGLESYGAFKRLMADLPAPPIAADPRFDFSDLAAFHERHFVGRAGVLEEITNFVRKRPSSWGVITALPGMGKTALLSMLFARHRVHRSFAVTAYDCWAFHFCSTVDSRNSPTVALRSLVAQLCDFAGEERGKWLSTDLDQLRNRCFPDLVGLVASGLTEGGRLVLVVDALDEGFGAEPESVGSALPCLLPHNAVGLLSWRVASPTAHNERVEQSIKQIPVTELTYLASASPMAGLERVDVERFLSRLGEAPTPSPTLATVEACWAASTADAGLGADPFFLRLVADGVGTGAIRLLINAETNQPRGDSICFPIASYQVER
jgi:hypothetical protein